jgi:Ser/Thr protein kinase RdoA (MazF antagonist)
MIDLPELSHVWQLAPILSSSLPSTGTIHQTLLIKTLEGDYVLRGYRYKAEDRWRIEYEHAIIKYAQAHGLPTLSPLHLPGGETIFEHEDHFYALFPFARGHQSARGHLTLSEVEAMGSFLGQLHRALHDYPHERVHERSLVVDRVATLAAMDTIEATIRAQTSIKDEDQQSLSHLAERRAWLATVKPVDERKFSLLENQVIHGDYQETNLFFDGDKVSAVIDWDQAYVALRAWEVVRALHYAFKLEEVLCRTFLRAYRQILPLPLADLEVAASFYGWIRAYDLWAYEEIYLRGNQ